MSPPAHMCGSDVEHLSTQAGGEPPPPGGAGGAGVATGAFTFAKNTLDRVSRIEKPKLLRRVLFSSVPFAKLALTRKVRFTRFVVAGGKLKKNQFAWVRLNNVVTPSLLKFVVFFGKMSVTEIFRPNASLLMMVMLYLIREPLLTITG